LPPDYQGAGDRILPGSSIKGAVRSLHETLAGGCLRVFDAEFVPVYRQMMRDAIKTSANESDHWTLAWVCQSQGVSGIPTFRPAKRVVWVREAFLPKDGYTPKTGDRFNILGVPQAGDEPQAGDGPAAPDLPIGVESAFGRDYLTSGEVLPDPNGDWFIMVSDASARDKSKGYFYAFGEIGDLKQEPVTVEPAVWAGYLDRLEGSDDLRTANQGTGDYQEVRFKGKSMGMRRTLSRDPDNTLLWVRVKGEEENRQIACISAAVIWRTKGEKPAGDRVGESLKACSDPSHLCPTCRVFGMVDATGSSGMAEQRAYASHVRFLAARKHSGQVEDPRWMRPLQAPRPGFGPFYLEIKDENGAPKASPESAREPTGRWGSGHDSTKPRPLRGRKYYWHADPEPDRKDANRRTGPLEQDQAVPRASTRWWFDGPTKISRAFAGVNEGGDKSTTRQGSTFTGTLRSEVLFEGLTEVELGGLLAALVPARLLVGGPGDQHGERGIATHLGGGKPLGLGSVKPRIVGIQAWGAERYAMLDDAGGAGAEKAPPTWEETALNAVAAFKGANEATLGHQWSVLTHVLDLAKVDPDLVWYPPGRDRSAKGTAFAQFLKSYEFFKDADGHAANVGGKKGAKIIPLPDPTEDDQRLPISPPKTGEEET
jgi:hypothetical protein